MIGANFSAYGSTNGMTQTDDHARHQAVARSRCRSSAATTRRVAAGAVRAETVAPVIGPRRDITVDAAEPDEHGRHLPDADRHRQRGPDARTSAARRPPARRSRSARRSSPARRRDAKGNTSTKTFTVTVRGTQPVGGTVPATLALTLGAPASFGAFTPGVAKDYTADDAPPTSSARPATRRSASPTRGHLINGTFALPRAAAGGDHARDAGPARSPTPPSRSRSSSS